MRLATRPEAGPGALGLDLTRRLAAEALGSALLLVAVVGSGIMASRLSPDDRGLQLLESAAATGAALAGVILMFGAVSGAHLNPAVTLVDRLLGSIGARDAALYVVAQTVGAGAGTLVANAMFERPVLELATTTRSSGALWLSEVVATVGLLLLIHGCGRGGRARAVPFAVGAWIAGAYWFTSSTGFANPAVTVARMLSDSFAGIEPASVPMFVAMQIAGAVLAGGLIRLLYPAPLSRETTVPAPDRPLDDRPTVLFLCVHNAGRSQMALGWFTHLAGDRAVARSGGSEPASQVNPSAVAAMAEVGIDISREHPERWTEEVVRAADVVVTMGCGDACPLHPGQRYEDWDLDDPAGRDVDAVRPIRDAIRTRVEALLADLGIPVG